LKGEAQW